MPKLKKPLPQFTTEEEEAEYWDNHSLLEHFDEFDFKSLQVKAAKDRPITIRLDSESRQRLDEIARVYKVGPSTLSRMFITSALQQWKRKQQISMTLEDAAEALIQPMPDEFKQEALALFEECKTGSFYILPESKLERLSRLFIRSVFEAAGYKIRPDDELQDDARKKSQYVEVSASGLRGTGLTVFYDAAGIEFDTGAASGRPEAKVLADSAGI